MNAELNTRLKKQLDGMLVELTEKALPVTADRPGEDERITEQHRLLQGRIQFLRRVAAALAFVHPETLVEGRIGFGSEVKVEDTRTGEALSYTLMNGEELDLDAGEISLASPVGQALLGSRVGEVVEVDTPQRRRRFRITSAVSLFDRLELAERAAAAYV